MHRWGGKMKVTRGETQWINNLNLEREDMWSTGQLRVRGANKKKSKKKKLLLSHMCPLLHLTYADVN